MFIVNCFCCRGEYFAHVCDILTSAVITTVTTMTHALMMPVSTKLAYFFVFFQRQFKVSFQDFHHTVNVRPLLSMFGIKSVLFTAVLVHSMHSVVLHSKFPASRTIVNSTVSQLKCGQNSYLLNTTLLNTHTRARARVIRPFVRDYPGEPVPER